MKCATVFSGCVPALMTPCDAAGTPDFDALAGTGRELIDAGMRAVVYSGSMGDWPLLDHPQRKRGVEALVAALEAEGVDEDALKAAREQLASS